MGMGANKYVCFACRKVVNTQPSAPGLSACPSCGGEQVVLPHRFRPPKQREAKKWAVVQYLVEHGFRYQHINSAYFPKWPTGGVKNYVRYPKNLRGAKEFVEAYRVYGVARY